MAEQLMALAKSGISTAPEIAIQNLNAVIFRNSHGIEVLDLGKGSPVCSLPLNAKQSTLADVNGDEIIDLVKLNVHEESGKSDCFLVTSDALVTSSVLFNSSVCHRPQVVDMIGGLRVVHSLKCCR